MMSLAEKVFHAMYDNDKFSQWLGIELIAIGQGTCTLKMQVREEMLNGFSISHGGISYSFADSALAFSCNSHGKKAVSIHTSIEHLKPIKLNDILIAHAEEKSRQNKIASYEVVVKNQHDEVVALFHGLVFRKEEHWFDAENK